MMSSSPCTSKKCSLENHKSIKASEAGIRYQELTLALLARRGYELSKVNSKFRNFSVGREVGLDEDWKFDDIMFSYIDEDDTKNLICLQIKHKLSDFRIDSQSLSAEATRVKNGMQRNFNLQKYFISYLSVREKLNHTEEIAEELRNGKIKCIGIFTNIALNTEDLNNNGFRLKEAPYDITNLLSLNKSIAATEDFDHCYQLSDISEGLRKIFKKSSDLYRLAREIARYVVSENLREFKIMGIDKTPIKYYHVALEREVIQKSYQVENELYCMAQFRDDFLENDEPGPRQMLRDAIFEAVRELDESKKDASNGELKHILKQIKWKLVVNFGETKRRTKTNLSCEWMTVKDEDIADFLKCLVFIVNQPTVTELEELFQATVMYEAALRQIIHKREDLVLEHFNPIINFSKDLESFHIAFNKDAVIADAVINKDATVQRKGPRKALKSKSKGYWTIGLAIVPVFILNQPIKSENCDQFVTFNKPEISIHIQLAVILTLRYEHEIKQYGKFSKLQNLRESLHRFLLSSKQILYITTSVTLMSSIKILRSLDGIINHGPKDGRMSVDFDILKSKISRKSIVKSFELERSNLLIIECRHSVDEQDIEEFYYKLSKVVRDNSEKKIILIVQQEGQNILSDKFKDDFPNNGQFMAINDSIDLNDFVPKEDPLKKELIVFQGQKQRVSLAELTGIEDFHSQRIFQRDHEIIDVTTLISILNDDEIEIGSKPHGTCNLLGAYVKLFEEINTKTLADKLSQKLGNTIEEIYIMSGISGSNKQDKIEKLIKCLGLANKKEVIEEQLGDIGSESRIQIADDQFKDKDFKFICQKNPEKEVFWLYIEDEQKFIQRKFYNPNFYLKRKFKNVIVKKEVKELLMDDNLAEIFIFSPINDLENFYELLGLTDEKEKRNIENIYKHLNNSTIKICNSEDAAVAAFKELCRVNQTVHRLKFEENKLVWCDSHGSVNSLRKFIGHKESEISLVEEDNLIEEIKNKKVVIIADDPGTGKTTTVTKLYESKYLSTSLIETHWIVRINIMENLQAIRDIKFPDGCVDIVSVINFMSQVDVKLNNNLAKSLLRIALDKNENFSKPLLLVLDGFGEILDEVNRKKLVLLLKFLRNETAAKLWITTRLHFKYFLENELSTFAIQFIPMDPDTQFNYIKMYLKDRLRLILNVEKFDELFADSDKRPTAIKKFVEAFLNKMSVFKMKIPNFIGTPLQLHLMLEGSIMHFKCSIENDDDYQNFSYLGDDAWEVHKNLIGREYDDFFLKADIEEPERQRQEKFLINMYCKELAISLIFKLEPKNTLKTFQDKALLTGIITSHGSNIEFILASFRDYFASKVFIHWMKEKPDELSSTKKQEYILKEIFKRPDFRLIRTFINLKLKKIAEFDSLKEITQQYGKIIEKLLLEEQCPLIGTEGTVLHIAIKERNLYIAYFLLNSLERHKHVLKKFLFMRNERKETTLHLACIEKVVELVKILLGAVAGISKDIKEHKTCLKEFLFMCDENGKTALHLACREGTSEVVRILLEAAAEISEDTPECKTCLKEFLFMCDENGKTALHFACREGTGEVVRILLKAAEGISEDMKEHKTCLKEFLFMCDENGETALHLACREVASEVIGILLKAAEGISKDTQEHESVYKEFIFVRNVSGKTALHFVYDKRAGGIVTLMLDALSGIPEATLFLRCLKTLNQKH